MLTNKKRADYSQYFNLLRYEMIPAYGCTEPGTLAYAATVASSILGRFPEKIDVLCSSSIIKNVFSVDIPNAEDMKGPRAAVILGAIISNPDLRLCVLQNVTENQLSKARELYNSDYCSVSLAPSYDCLYIQVLASCGSDSVEVEIFKEHTNISSIKRNGVVLEQAEIGDVLVPDKSFLNLKGIIDFADNCDITQISNILEQEIEFNTAISNEGLENEWGLSVGKKLLNFYDENDVRTRARAKAAAASDARMAGCVLPVVINSGSGNQGLTVSLPVIEFAKTNNVSHEKLLRSLALANLIAILQKRTVGNLSAFCGAVHAAAGAASGICYMTGGTYEEISNTISFTLGTVGGMICDGAKASCAAKISQALDTAIMGMQLAKDRKFLKEGDGLVMSDVEHTIDSFGKVGREGMQTTNEVILDIMLKHGC